MLSFARMLYFSDEFLAEVHIIIHASPANGLLYVCICEPNKHEGARKRSVVIMKCEIGTNSNVSFVSQIICGSCDANGAPFSAANFMCVVHARGCIRQRQLGIRCMHLTYDICAKILHLHRSQRHFIVVNNMLTAKLFTIMIKF